MAVLEDVARGLVAWVPTPAYSWEGWYPVETGNVSSGDSLVKVIIARRHSGVDAIRTFA